MTTTLKPIFDALNYPGEGQQRDIVKLLQVSQAYGELPNVDGVLSDKQAQAVLDTVTFPTLEKAAQWLHDATQSTMLRPAGTERYQSRDTAALAQHRPELMAAIANTGMLSEVKPSRKHYDHAVVLGAMQGGVDNRLNALKDLWDEGVRFDQVHLLGSERPLVPEQEPIATIPGADGHKLATEIQMMQALYYEKREAWPDELKNIPVFAVNTGNKQNGARADTRDTLAAWVDAKPRPGRALVISSQPYVEYQDSVVKSVLPASFNAETIGAPVAEDKVKISVAMDSLARQIDAAFPQLLEALARQKPAPLPALMMIDPAQIQVDAATYQFRSGGDDKGVTAQGRYQATRWDAILHGEPLLLHKRLDGKLFVADGHHRLELAQRLNAQKQGPGLIAAQVLSEADGYTAQDVKIIAAYKNIAHGQTDPVETARVFKEAKTIAHREWLPSLQMDKGNLTMSYTLSGLSEPALESVAKKEITPEVGAMIAERIADPARQEAVVQFFSRAQALQPETPATPISVYVPEPSPAKEPEIDAGLKKGRWVQLVTRDKNTVQERI
jgi:hypothetical protein